MTHSIITLVIDCGYKDHYVAVMKRVILNINPKAKIVDISHHVSPHNIAQGAILLHNAYSYFPKGTIHVAVVDPGVGSERKPILVKTNSSFFIGPDNGIFGLIYEQLKKIRSLSLPTRIFFQTS